MLFGAAVTEADAEAFDLLTHEIPTTPISVGELDDADVPELFVRAGLSKSKGEVRKNAGGHYVNQVPVAERDGAAVDPSELLHGRYLLLRKGKAKHHLLVVG